MHLYIGNKNLSSWSMRVWLVCTAFDLPFEEVLVRFSTPDQAENTFAQTMQSLHSNGKVPALVHDDHVIWDSLAICEYLAELFPAKHLWPEDRMLRARARCISAEMHSSFTSLRNHCPMNITANLAQQGQVLWSSYSDLRQDVARIEQIWAERPQPEGFLCGHFSIADAFYAPVVSRLISYQFAVHPGSQQYMHTMLAHPAVRLWIQGARAEIVA
ncbi:MULTISPECIES: glutathione S-transferase family protein [Acinetobacter]|uniref:glutathione S-transferase family protein n=1 Tax=Acinetobacter TaxID=469 RepID=UPI000EA26D01|nr:MULTISPECIES: glutathione S-transferase family protein [Acinetobacter]RKG45383.1 glutathione S-transferase family protein [Acinetobacter cumulans]RZG60318.1 glutathione S-transferase family protein [Acinetobacter sp. WCHAc060006]